MRYGIYATVPDEKIGKKHLIKKRLCLVKTRFLFCRNKKMNKEILFKESY